jgi:glucose-6-phosphate 1-epimerase
VVWNPWIDKAARMSDFGDAEYLHMVCIEAANAESDSITVAPGDTHSLGTAISASMG